MHQAIKYFCRELLKILTRDNNSDNFQESEGVIPRTVKELFVLNSDGAAKIFVSFTEVYNEGVYDLLSANPTKKMHPRG